MRDTASDTVSDAFVERILTAQAQRHTLNFELADEAAQVAMGGQLAKALDYRGLMFLVGDLGAGKTTLSRGVLHSMGYEGAVKSPTYTLLEPYDLERHKVFHYDLYRLGDPEELEFIGGRDLFSDQALHLVEWPSMGEGWLPLPDLIVQLAHADTGRTARVNACTDRGIQALNFLEREAMEL
ncbi:hypothetical protein LMG33818_000695 [Halomonadaceae bacterium LMG 33818]|uniref:tRNA (adenosine(37)-N6)-threonylcarbamoyltransferase complex ATPase subunit type 1 TsaE n=1 Tax=Cernens ardua TaxID=3402176 RepID=UPI003EDC16DB